MRKKITMTVIIWVIMVYMTACGYNCEKKGHVWTNNGCKAYQTCEKCGEQGEYIEHFWQSEKCETYKICTECGKQGGYSEHTWESYGCETHKTCTACGKQGEYIEHNLDSRGICTLCGETIGLVIELNNSNIKDYLSFECYTEPAIDDGVYSSHMRFSYNIKSRSSEYTFENTMVYVICNGRGGNREFYDYLLIDGTLDKNGSMEKNGVLGEVHELKEFEIYVVSGCVYINTTPEEWGARGHVGNVNSLEILERDALKEYSESGALVAVKYEETASDIDHTKEVYNVVNKLSNYITVKFDNNKIGAYNSERCVYGDEVSFNTSKEDFELYDNVSGKLIDKIGKNVEVCTLWQNLFYNNSNNGLLEVWECVYCKFNDKTEGLVGFRLVDKVVMPEMASDPNANPIELANALLKELRRFYDTWSVCGTMVWKESGDIDSCFQSYAEESIIRAIGGGDLVSSDVYQDMRCRLVIDNLEGERYNEWLDEYFIDMMVVNNIMVMGTIDNTGNDAWLILYQKEPTSEWKTGYLKGR